MDETTPSFRVCTEINVRSNKNEKVVTRCVMKHRGVSQEYIETLPDNKHCHRIK